MAPERASRTTRMASPGGVPKAVRCCRRDHAAAPQAAGAMDDDPLALIKDAQYVWASRPAFAFVLKNKPVLILTATPSPTGGARAHAQLRETLAGTLSRVVARRQLTIAGVDQKLEGGRLHRPNTIQILRDSLINLVDEIKMVRSVLTYKVQ